MAPGVDRSPHVNRRLGGLQRERAHDTGGTATVDRDLGTGFVLGGVKSLHQSVGVAGEHRVGTHRHLGGDIRARTGKHHRSHVGLAGFVIGLSRRSSTHAHPGLGGGHERDVFASSQRRTRLDVDLGCAGNLGKARAQVGLGRAFGLHLDAGRTVGQGVEGDVLCGIQQRCWADRDRRIALGLHISQAQGDRRLQTLQEQVHRLLLDAAGDATKRRRGLDGGLHGDVFAFDRARHIDAGVGVGQGDQGLTRTAVLGHQVNVTGCPNGAAGVDHRRVKQRIGLHGDVGCCQHNVAAVAGGRHAGVGRVLAGGHLAGVDHRTAFDGQRVVAPVHKMRTAGQVEALHHRIVGVHKHQAGGAGVAAGIK